MPPPYFPQTAFNHLPALRVPGLDFDRPGQKSNLRDLLELGGHFPCARILDRLPFSADALRRWSNSRDRELASCFARVPTVAGNRSSILFIDLNRFDAFLHARAGIDQTSRSFFGDGPAVSA
jgi:hypothetical protein